MLVLSFPFAAKEVDIIEVLTQSQGHTSIIIIISVSTLEIYLAAPKGKKRVQVPDTDRI